MCMRSVFGDFHLFHKEDNMLFNIKSTPFEQVPQGGHQAVFESVTEYETSKGQAYRWVFKTDSGKIISGFAGEPGKTPTLKNKFGRWLLFWLVVRSRKEPLIQRPTSENDTSSSLTETGTWKLSRR